MTNVAKCAVYDRTRSYAWNYKNAPEPAPCEVPAVADDWSFCGLQVDSPIGVPAGPLLNGKWCLYYASLGFDVVTYKTVRTRQRQCYPMPNLQPVDSPQLRGGESRLRAVANDTGAWAVAFGMPSMAPDVWRADVEAARSALPSGKLLPVSVVGTIQDGWTLDQLADDYALCAKWAVESGADCVEVNFSCPNVSTCDGQLYQQHDDARIVAQRTRDAIGRVPLIVKIGHINSADEAAGLVATLDGIANALSTTNSVAATVVDGEGREMFNGQRRGICGSAIREASLAQVATLARVIRQRGATLDLIGVGGISTTEHVDQYLAAGATSVQIATAAMLDPEIALKIRAEMNSRRSR